MIIYEQVVLLVKRSLNRVVLASGWSYVWVGLINYVDL